MAGTKEIDVVVFEMSRVCDFRGKVKKDKGRKYEYFKEVVNRIPIERNHQMIRMYKVMCKLNQIKGFEDVSIIPADIKVLVKQYNDDDSNKYEITYGNETPSKPRYYLNYKPKPVKQPTCVNINDISPNTDMPTRDEWCVDWAVKNIFDKFKMFGYGYKFRAKDLVGKKHPYCETSKYYICNTHIAEARRKINSSEVYRFCISKDYVIEPKNK